MPASSCEQQWPLNDIAYWVTHEWVLTQACILKIWYKRVCLLPPLQTTPRLSRPAKAPSLTGAPLCQGEVKGKQSILKKPSESFQNDYY